MKRLLAAALLACALLAGYQSSARADGGCSFGMGWNMNWSSYSNKQKCCGGGGCGTPGCLPPPCWSGCYPQPTLFSGYGNFPGCNPYAYPYANPYGDFNFGYPAPAWPGAGQPQQQPKDKATPRPLPTDGKDK